MKRTPTTQLAVLGGLSVAPMSGYALRQAIRETLGHFWSESFGQIYPALAELEAQGFVTRLDAGRTSGSRFAITEAGLEQLRAWLAEPFESAPPRSQLLLRLFFGRQLGDDGCRKLILEARADAERRIAEYGGIRAELEREAADGDPDAKYFLITVAAGMATARAALEWTAEALEILDRP